MRSSLLTPCLSAVWSFQALHSSNSSTAKSASNTATRPTSLPSLLRRSPWIAKITHGESDDATWRIFRIHPKRCHALRNFTSIITSCFIQMSCDSLDASVRCASIPASCNKARISFSPSVPFCFALLIGASVQAKLYLWRLCRSISGQSLGSGGPPCASRAR